MLAPVVQKMDSTLHWINRYPVDRGIIRGNQLRYLQAPVVQKVNNTIHWIDIYPMNSAAQLVLLILGERYPTFEQPRPDG